MSRVSWGGDGCFPTGLRYPGIAHLMRVAAAGLAEEFAADTPVAELPIASIDTETTGRDPKSDRIVEIACVVYQAGEIKAKHDWLVNPEQEIPKEAFDVHGISDADVKDKPVFKEIVPELAEVLQGLVPAAYNAIFDKQFVLAELKRAGSAPASPPPTFRKAVRWVDPLTWARELYREQRSKSLGAMAEHLGVALENAHRATDDAAAAALVFSKFLGDQRVPATYGPFMQEQQRLDRAHAEQRQYWR